MGERAVIDKGMETLAEIGQGESTTFVMPQELTSLVGRYGSLSGSDVEGNGTDLESLEFDDETRELIGLDDIADIIGEIDEQAEMDVEAMEEQARAIDQGRAGRGNGSRRADHDVETEDEPEPELGSDSE